MLAVFAAATSSTSPRIQAPATPWPPSTEVGRVVS